MSFVLDALKVSEQRRSRFRRRIYAHPPRARRRGGRRGWLAALGALAGVALVALAWRLAAPVPGPDGPSGPAASGITAAAPPVQPLTGNPGTLAAQAPGVEAGAVLAPPGPAIMPARIDAQPEGIGPQMPLPGTGEKRAGQQSGTALQTAESVLAAPPPDWPALSLQMLFFSEEEGRSFVQVNGKTYRQGERLPAGPEVLRITGEGVTLAYRGQRALLGVER